MDPGSSRRSYHLALALLFGVNFLNYIDRYVIAAVAVLIQRDFGLGDTQMGLVGSMFMVAYMVASPFTGVMGDRWPRFWLVGGGVLVWSLATVLSGLAGSYHQLLLARSVIGIGEAGFGVVAPTLISDLFSREKRGRMLAFFYVAIPVGSALGFLLGGFMGAHHGWRAAFFLAGAPGLLLGLLAFAFKDPPRGAGDGVSAAHEQRFDGRPPGGGAPFFPGGPPRPPAGVVALPLKGPAAGRGGRRLRGPRAALRWALLPPAPLQPVLHLHDPGDGGHDLRRGAGGRSGWR